MNKAQLISGELDRHESRIIGIARVATKMNTTEFLRSSRRTRFGLAALLLLASVSIFACAGGPDAPRGATHVLTANGEVNPVMQRYIDRGIGAAEDKNAGAVVIRMDTPGGLSSSIDKIIERILASKCPWWCTSGPREDGQ